MKFLNILITALAAFALGFTVAHVKPTKTVTKTVERATPVETIYIVNHATRYISDREIKKDIPAWELAANRDFAPAWHTAQVKIVFLGREKSPRGAIVATFKSQGPIQSALAFHYVERGVPAIVVYAGTGRYYGYDNSVSFTHELFETLADHQAGMLGNQGYPYPFIYINQQVLFQTEGTWWLQEVSDPVEKYAYKVQGVPISDFVLPNWYNDHVSGAYDFMGITQAPFTIAKGGYACSYVIKWTCLTNFRHAGRDAAGFLKGEREPAKH